MIMSRLCHALGSRWAAAPAYAIRYTRQYMEYVDQGMAKEKEQKEVTILTNYQESLKKLKFNDHNPQNHVPVRMNHKLFEYRKNKQEQREIENVKDCWILESGLPEPPKVMASAIRKYIITSIKKATLAMKVVKKKYTLDAIEELEKSHKKVAKLMIRTFHNLIDHAKQKGLNKYRLFVHGCLIGKTKRYRGLRYHAKGKGAVEKRDFCQVRIIYYQKNEEEFYREIANGHCPPGLAKLIRHKLMKDDASFEELVEYTGITTAKGRQQAREILKRKTDLEMLNNKKQGRYEPRKVIYDRLLDERAAKMKVLIEKFIDEEENDSLRKREILHKKNQQAN